MIKKVLIIALLIVVVANQLFAQVGSLDTTLNIAEGFDRHVSCIKTQPDGKILVGGPFTNYCGKNVGHLIRINQDGSLDTTFNSGSGVADFNGVGSYSEMSAINSIVLQTDDKILIGGCFTGYNGKPLVSIARLHPNGELDTTFKTTTAQVDNRGDYIYCISIQPDGKVLIAGALNKYNNVAVNKIVRLNASGSIDSTFNPGAGANDIIYSMLLQDDGKIIISGVFTKFNNTDRKQIVRLNADGSLDNSFSSGTGVDANILDMALQNNGKLLIGGFFTTYNGINKQGIVELNNDGSISNTFNVDLAANYYVTKIRVQSDSKILIGGFSPYTVQPPIQIFTRLFPTGAEDGSFSTATKPVGIMAMDLQPDGNILIGGYFSNINGVGRNHLARIIGDCPDDSCDMKLSFTKIQEIDCYHNSGSAIILANGGYPPYKYSWINASPSIDSSAVLFMAKVYSCVVKDNRGCTKTASLKVSAPKYSGNYDINTNLITTQFRPGFDAFATLSTVNLGCSPISGELKLVLDPLLSYKSAVPSPDFIRGDTLIWNYNNLIYKNTAAVPKVVLSTSQSAKIGDTIHLQLLMDGILGDMEFSNNNRDYYYPVINGYDPNDIQVNPRGNCDKNYIKNDQTLTYTVRFQNTGNAEAINISVLDSLSSNLDLSTLRILASSDTMYTMILPNNVAKFMFDSIMLADSNSNEAASHGYVVFEIKPKANLSNETKIENKVGIYFDYNPAVVTNTVFNTITDGSAYPCLLSGVEKLENRNSALYPNPSSGIFTLTSSSLQQNITVYDQTGRTIMNIIPTQNTTSFDLSNVSNGMYFIQVKSNESVQVLKAVVQK